VARKHRHEEHANHEAWAIPYGDLITLLLAFFVVMYSMSSVNEGKYRVLADSLRAAFRGAPKTTEPIQLGDKVATSMRAAPTGGIAPSQMMKLPDMQGGSIQQNSGLMDAATVATQGDIDQVLRSMADEVERAMRPLIEQNLIHVERKQSWIEIEIKTDILFPSGSASIAEDAVPVLEEIADILKPFPNPIRVEGHTDDKPIRTLEFPSNWELSAARAAGVVNLYSSRGIDPRRMVVSGMGEYRPAAENSTSAGRGRNRRVVLVVMAGIDTETEYQRENDAKSKLATPVVEVADGAGAS